ncbi:hypothetical protein GQ464_004215 [Rhodocaloribacter litoris]|uniref:arabinofuranosidase catalytic domain-containing protein n=1 Tax=Rhodocaloribacter litoris TaxID=2558931 RepID=UPI001E508C6A|nr:arabinofuranosidase catalytic domain-containing protein [Rhodocaloribacter litoris]QXD16164.1 hypothetical protein GQ464_004215 [Rhodocaloribacter litoris]
MCWIDIMAGNNTSSSMETVRKKFSTRRQGMLAGYVVGCLLLLVCGMSPAAAQSYLLDDYPDAYAAYSLRKLSSSYDGPVIRVRRSSDNAEQDIGFGADGLIDEAALLAFVGAGDGYVVKWYDQSGNGAHVSQSDPGAQPIVVENGVMIKSDTDDPTILFLRASDNPRGLVDTKLSVQDLQKPISTTDYMLAALVQRTGDTSREPTMIQVSSRLRAHEGLAYRGVQSYVNTNKCKPDIGPTPFSEAAFLPIVMRNGLNTVEFWQSNTLMKTKTWTDDADCALEREGDDVEVGGNNFTGLISEVIIYDEYDKLEPLDYYVNMALAFNIGDPGFNRDALLPQTYSYQVTLYDWLETIAVEDVALDMGKSFTFDPDILTDDELADLWIATGNLTTSRVVRGEPEWYVLDAGNGKGIEATGVVRIWHEPGSEYGGNPARSWANEPAQIYNLDIPLSGGGQGNPYYKDPAMGRRAMIVAIVDMIMYHQDLLSNNYAAWGDMFGKAFLSWAEAYRWAGEVMPQNVRDAFEEGMGYFLDHALTSDMAPRAVNTNMDMFFIHGAAEFYMATNNPELKAKAVQAVKRWLFGYPDGELETKHKVFPLDGTEPRGGVFSPTGYIMEGDQPDIFYGGESLYHLTGAVAAVLDRNTGAIPSEWQFMVEVIRRMEEFRLYQMFYEPGIWQNNKGPRTAYKYHGGAGYVGRTGAGVPLGQASGVKYKVIADLFPNELAYEGVYRNEHNPLLPSRINMIRDIAEYLVERTSEMQAVYVGTPREWNGWSPWVKETEYVPAKGWYSRLKALEGTNNSYPPIARSGYYYSKVFGGPPTGYEYWAYKNTDGVRDWGFFVEAQSRQGGYGGWYGGKIETFWTETTGVILINRHGKGGCDGNTEDSGCWDNLDYKAGHHVWGKDEFGKGFSTLHLRGQHLQRTAVFDLNRFPPSVTVKNFFNDPSVDVTSKKSGEETGYELEGQVIIENKIEALSNGARVTHTIISDATDMITELWASIPVFLRMTSSTPGDKPQMYLNDTTIEYWNGSSWKPMPEDQNGDGIPEIVTTTKLRLGRDFLLGEGPQYVYVGFPEGAQRVRLSTQIYYDPYQTKTSVRTVHFDLHGNPGTAISMPTNKSLQYTITTTEPDDVEGGETTTQTLTLAAGWNTVSLNVSPTNLAVETLLAGLGDQLVLVQNNTGKVYYPEFGINDIGTWNLLEAYEVNTRAAATLTVEGTPISPVAMPINLTTGWNLVPFLPAQEMPLETALASIADKLVVVIDNLGRIYYPEFGINDIGTMKPGQGYRMYVSGVAVLTYPLSP